MSKHRMLWTLLRGALTGAVLLAASSTAMAQATSRLCSADPKIEEQPGPACLLAHVKMGKPAAPSVYWSLYTYPDLQSAKLDQTGNASLVQAFGKTWLFSVGPLGQRPAGGTRVADVGPIAVEGDVLYDAEFLRSTFSPGMKAPIHVHSGPEAFFAISGAACLETPDGVQVSRQPNNAMVIKGGPPMSLMAIGTEPRKGFALILHDAAQAPTTLVNTWAPKGLCHADML